MVNHNENEWEWKGQKFMIQPGQTVTSLDAIKTLCGKSISTQNVRGALARFEKLNFLTNESTKQGRLITIVNWRDYQFSEDEANIASNKEPTKSQQRANTY